ncbi:Bph1p NDAI_0A00750 [Naumovozyma dairenensis CBS 421]|uniref:Beige protein homolog 1 n=1 Tax=Naumovozyma dairenensis (strain ATCC 10597 / BCRC 20456 / CBS 421 / NBRC 0211 / NRRL Y-12639) TaxID=1071378 RepID=G0W345_NAUDC|nr:hypothetical protein NDAI_0A00750 [Naumovozyma dairenensis CBS 421]CCD22233.1 hypothetical protein NDAI_0A00750 [Naumovozyma dairenensis CBS 421]
MLEKNEEDELIPLLDQLLVLTPDDSIAMGSLPQREHIMQILMNFCPIQDTIPVSDRSKSNYQDCDVADYVNLELNHRFQLSCTDNIFQISDDTLWLELLNNKWNSKKYIIALQIIIALTRNSLIDKQLLGKIPNFKSNLYNRLLTDPSEGTDFNILDKLSELYSVVLSVDCVSQDILNLYTHVHNNFLRSTLESLATQITDPLCDTYLQFSDSYITLPKYPRLMENLSLQFSISFDNIVSNRFMSLNKNIHLEIHGGQFSISNNNFILVLFDDFELIPYTLYSITLVMENREMVLYIDGDFINKISIFEHINSNKSGISIDLGSNISSFRLYRCCVWNLSLNAECIKILYLKSYIPDIISVNNHSLSKLVSAALLESIYQSLASPDVKYSTFLRRINVLNSQNLIINFTATDQVLKEEKNTKDIETTKKIQNYTLLDNDPDNDDIFGSNKIYYYKSSALVSMFISVNSIRLILCEFKKCADLKTLFALITHLFTLLQHPQLEKWFNEEFGFPVLAHSLITEVIQRLEEPLSIEFTNLFMTQCGINLDDPTDSILKNEIIWVNLVFNIHLWYFTSTEKKQIHPSVEIIRFIFFQVINLLETSKYKSYNLKILRKMEFIQKLSYQQHSIAGKSPNELIELKPDVTNVYLSLLKDNINKRDIQWYLNFAYYELKCKHVQTVDTVLLALDKTFENIMCENETNNLLIFVNSVSFKFLTMTLEEFATQSADPTLLLSIILKYLLVNKSLLNGSNGDTTANQLLAIFRKIDLIYCEKIVYLFYQYSLGNFKTSQSDLLLSGFMKESARDDKEIKANKLICISIRLLEWAVLNDVSTTFQIGLENFVFVMMKEVSALEKVDCNRPFFDPQTSNIPHYLLDLLLTMSKPQNSNIYEKGTLKIREILQNIIMHNLSNLDNASFEKSIQTLLNLGNQSHYLSIQFYNKKNNYFDLSIIKLIIPLVFDQFVNIGEVFPSILEERPYLLPNLLTLFDLVGHYMKITRMDGHFLLACHECIMQCLETIFTGTKQRIRNVSKPPFVALGKNHFFFIMYAVLKKQINWDTETSSLFYRSFLLYQQLLFTPSNNIFDENELSFLLIFLGSQLQQSPSNSLLISVIRTLLVHRRNSIKNIAKFLDLSNESAIQVLLNKCISLNDSEMISLLKKDSLSLFDRDQQERLLVFILKEINNCEEIKSLDDQHLFKQLYAMKQGSDELNYKDSLQLLELFHKDTEPFTNKILRFYVKWVSNISADMEEDSIVNIDKLGHIHFQLDQFLKVQNMYSSHSEWVLDNAEDINRSRRRLLPLYSPGERDIVKVEKKASSDLKNQTTRTSRSFSDAGSYDLLLDMDLTDPEFQDNMDENRNILKLLNETDSIKQIWNCCQVIGLDIQEGILIMGHFYVYFVSGYYFSKSKQKILKLVEAHDVNAKLISSSSNPNQDIPKVREVHVWNLFQMTFVIKKPFLLRDVAIEVLFENRVSCFFSFNDCASRNSVYHAFERLPKNHNIDPVFLNVLSVLKSNSSTIGSRNGISKLSLTKKFVNAIASSSDLVDGLHVTRMWQNGELSNFYYLNILNTLAGRSFNDLTQYPVFPWVIADYTSENLDLSNPKSYRDLSKPMGAQTERRRNEFIERYEALHSLNDPQSPPFHYGTHYSSAMIVSSFLIRLKPFIDSFLLLQDGKINHPDRLFNSVERAWSSSSAENTTDVRELIPEFFFLPELFININNFDFGKDHNKSKVNNVALPPWANNDPKVFIRKNREALESSYVSENLHKWIDLIFGFKQKGERAIEAVNVFNRLSYPGSVNLENIDDENERRAVVGIIHNFGQTPLQLFEEPHPPRSFTDIHHIDQKCWDEVPDVATKITGKAWGDPTGDNHSIQYINYRRSQHTKKLYCDGFPFLNFQYLDESTRFHIKLGSLLSLEINEVIFTNVHETEITSFLFISTELFSTGDSSGLIKIWKLDKFKQLKHLGNLYGHLSEIKEMHSYDNQNSLLSLDTSGTVILWDLMDHQPIRILTKNGLHISTSNNQGIIGIVDFTNNLKLFNLNGLSYDIKFKANGMITSLAFASFESLVTMTQNHMYWKEEAIILLGMSAGEVEIYELECFESVWKLKFLRRLHSGEKIPITCINSYIYKENKVSVHVSKKSTIKLNIAAGDCKGNLYTW